MSWLLLLYVAIAFVWITIICLALAAAIAIYLGFRYCWRRYLARRNERQLTDEKRLRAGFKTLRDWGWEDIT